MWSNNPTTGHKTGENHKFRKIHASQCSYNSREMKATLMSIDRQMDKEDVYIYILEYYPAIKKNEMMPYVEI